MTSASTKHLALERLEDRCCLTALGVPWPEIGHLRLSFAPDGTDAGGRASNLFAALDAQMPQRQWEETILRAFQTWAVQSNVNIGLVADQGQPFGTLGLKQSDPRFGDVRIGAYPMAADVLAVANPYDPFVANTWVGDVFFNSAFPFGGNGAGSRYDLFSVALHEAGHVLGIGHSSDPNSPMFPQFHSGGSLTPADVADLQTLYGPRAADAFEGPGGNETLAKATPLTFVSDGGNVGSIVAAADLSSLADVDTYRFVVPQGSQSLDVGIRVAGYSLLTPRLTLLDATGKVLSAAATTDPLNNDVSISLAAVEPGETYYVQVSRGRNDVFGVGGYELRVISHGLAPIAEGGASGADSTEYGAIPPSGYAPGNYRQHNNVKLLATTPGYVEHTYYELDDTVSPAWPTRIYEVRSADLGPDLTNVMSIVLNYSDNPDVKFKVAVLDDLGNLVATRVMTDFAGHLELQVPSVLSARDYFVKVRSISPPADGADYELRVDYAQDGTHLENYVNDALGRGQNAASWTLQVNESRQFHLVLGASDWSAPTETGLRMQIADQRGTIVYAMSVADGALRSGDVFLNRGRYSVTFTRAAEGVDTPVIFQLSGLTTSEPLGPQLRDTTRDPLDSSDASALAQLEFYWLPGDAAVTAAIPGDKAAAVPHDARNAVNTSSSVLYWKATPDPTPPHGGSQVALQPQDDPLQSPALARPNPDGGGASLAATDSVLALSPHVALHNWRFAAGPLVRTTSEASPRSFLQLPSSVPQKGPGKQPASPQLAESAPVAADEVFGVEAAYPSQNDVHPSDAPATVTGNGRLIAQFFAWYHRADARRYAVWTIPPVFAALGWFAWKQLERSERHKLPEEARSDFYLRTSRARIAGRAPRRDRGKNRGASPYRRPTAPAPATMP